MRRRDRIPRIIELLGQLWDLHPDMRLLQLMENFVGVGWYQEDDITEKCLIYQLEKAGKKIKTLARLK